MLNIFHKLCVLFDFVWSTLEIWKFCHSSLISCSISLYTAFPFLFLIFFCLISVSFILIEFVYKPLFFADEEELTEKKENSVIELTDSP